MTDRTLNQFLRDQTAEAMSGIEEEIYDKVRQGICAFFDVDDVSDLTQDEIQAISDAEMALDKGFLKLGYKMVLKRRSQKKN